jgi:hypothetical protein
VLPLPPRSRSAGLRRLPAIGDARPSEPASRGIHPMVRSRPDAKGDLGERTCRSHFMKEALAMPHWKRLAASDRACGAQGRDNRRSDGAR